MTLEICCDLINQLFPEEVNAKISEIMNTKDLIQLGVPPGESSRRGMEYIAKYILKGLDKAKLADDVAAVVRDPAAFIEDELRGRVREISCPLRTDHS